MKNSIPTLSFIWIFFLKFAEMKKAYSGILLILMLFRVIAQTDNCSFWKVYSFYIPESHSKHSAYVELTMSINARLLSIQKQPSSSHFFSAIQGIVKILNDSILIKTDTFIVKSPSSDDSLKIPDFAYIRRYWLDNNKHYTFELTIKDYFTHQLIYPVCKKQLHINYEANKISMSEIVLIDTLEKSSEKSIFYKHGYNIIPYNDNYYNEYMSYIFFYNEIYNADTTLGKNEPFILKYYIQDKDNNKNMEAFGGFRKFNASKVNVLIGNINIKELPSGNYNLIVELRNKENELILTQKKFFQKKNKSIAKKQSLNDELFFGNTNNIDTLKMWVEALWPIANNLEKEWIINQSINKDATMMKNFMIDFWDKRASDTASAIDLAKRYYTQVNFVMKNFKCGKIAPYYTDRGRVFLQYGAPNQRTIQLSETGAYPYEIWQYYRLYDASTGQFFSNRKFVFVNKGIADECYTLIHSDMKGEFNNPNWQRDIMKHEVYNINDPYQQQKINYGNNFDKLYQNPQ